MEPLPFGEFLVSRAANPAFQLPRMWQGRAKTVYKLFLPGMTSSKTMNPTKEGLFSRELLAQGVGSYWKNGLPLGGITSL
jgi:hypothetical protein